jgi:hypothetical protein
MSRCSFDFEHKALSIDEKKTLAAFDLLKAVKADGDSTSSAPFSVVLTLWLSSTAPLGVAARPIARRSFSRRQR